MCEFVSWIDKDGEIGFLTDDIVSKRLEEYKKYNPVWREDICGHGAIEWFMPEFKDGEHHEYTGSDINKYPKEVIKAIKQGKMTLIGINTNLLNDKGGKGYEEITQPARKKYNRIQQQAYKKYFEIQQPAWKKYEEIQQPAYMEYLEIKQQAWKKYEEIQQPAWKEYIEIKQQAWKKYEEIQQPAYKKYLEIQQQEFWKIFSNKDNRLKEWR